jgi:hypothetical protein
MGKKVIQFPRRKRAPEFPPVAQRRSRTIVVHVGAQRCAIDIACAATALPPGTDPTVVMVERAILAFVSHKRTR